MAKIGRSPDMDEEDSLVCNYAKCRKQLKHEAYVTACSHVFCNEHGEENLLKSHTCPACQTSLSAKFEIVRRNLKPTNQCKSMMLAGLKPDVVSDICLRALTFWIYQSNQEKAYQVHTANKAKKKASQLELYYEQTLSRTNAELNSLVRRLPSIQRVEKEQIILSKQVASQMKSKSDAEEAFCLRQQLSTVKESLEETKKKYSEVCDKLTEKTRQHQKLQGMYYNRREFYTMPSKECWAAAPGTPTLNLPLTPAAGDAPGSRFEFNPRPESASSRGPSNAVGHRSREDFTVNFNRVIKDDYASDFIRIKQDFSSGFPTTPRK